MYIVRSRGVRNQAGDRRRSTYPSAGGWSSRSPIVFCNSPAHCNEFRLCQRSLGSIAWLTNPLQVSNGIATASVSWHSVIYLGCSRLKVASAECTSIVLIFDESPELRRPRRSLRLVLERRAVCALLHRFAQSFNADTRNNFLACRFEALSHSSGRDLSCLAVAAALISSIVRYSPSPFRFRSATQRRWHSLHFGPSVVDPLELLPCV